MGEVDIGTKCLFDSLVPSILEAIVNGERLPQTLWYSAQTSDNCPGCFLATSIGNLGDTDETTRSFYERIQSNRTFS
jgi:hypothetical protein